MEFAAQTHGASIFSFYLINYSYLAATETRGAKMAGARARSQRRDGGRLEINARSPRYDRTLAGGSFFVAFNHRRPTLAINIRNRNDTRAAENSGTRGESEEAESEKKLVTRASN